MFGVARLVVGWCTAISAKNNGFYLWGLNSKALLTGKTVTFIASTNKQAMDIRKQIATRFLWENIDRFEFDKIIVQEPSLAMD